MAPQPGRNEPCPCGSGNKYKRCCLEKDEAARSAELAQRAAEAAASAAARNEADPDGRPPGNRPGPGTGQTLKPRNDGPRSLTTTRRRSV